MSKTALGVIITIIALGGIAGVVIVNNKDDDKKQSQTSSNQDDMANMDEGQAPIADQNAPASSDSSTQVASGSVNLEVKDFAYSQKSLKVKKGAKVTWTNQDSVKHNITPDSPSDNFKGSELLGKGESYSFTFSAVGTYTYHCSPHPYMKASVEVVE